MKANIKVRKNSQYYQLRRPYHRRISLEEVPDIEFDKEGALNGETGCHTLKLSGDQLDITTFKGYVQRNLQVKFMFILSGLSSMMLRS